MFFKMRKLLWLLPLLVVVGAGPPGCDQGQTQSGGDTTIRVMSCVGACTPGGNETVVIGSSVEKVPNSWYDNGESYTWDGDPCSMPNHSLHLTDADSVYFNSSTPIAGFQFNVDGANVVSAIGGDAGAAGFTMPTGGNTVLGFSLQGSTISGCGTMVSLVLNGNATGLSGIVMSDADGAAIPFSQLQ